MRALPVAGADGGSGAQHEALHRPSDRVACRLDAATARCFYVPARELGPGMNTLTLRLLPARDGQRRGIRMAAEFEAPDST